MTATRRTALAGTVAALTTALVVGLPGTAAAHPLGNFTVNRYSGLVVASDAVTVDHVLDLAEIPTAQRTPQIDTDSDGTLSRPELAGWARTACAAAAADLRLTVGGARAPLSVTAAQAASTPGQAGLPVLRLECGLTAKAAVDRPTGVGLTDPADGGEVGWREMTARGDGTTLTGSDVPRRSRSDRLTAYPQDLLASPPDVRALFVTAVPGGPRLAGADEGAAPAGRTGRAPDVLTGAVESLLARSDGHPWLALVTVLAAVVLGAAHALAPGHGKTIMAFYLSGRRGRALRAAATVGATVTVTHTAGVLALGLLVGTTATVAPARLYPWLGLASGLLVTVVGLALLRDAARRTPRTGHSADGTHRHGLLGRPHTHVHHAAPRHAHGTAEHDGAGTVATLARPVEHHGHDHAHDHAHHDPHEHPEPPPPSRSALIAMGVAGGLVPSPSALLLLLGAVALGQAWFGVLLVVGFGLGMAGTLATVGLVVMRLRDRAESRLRARPGTRVAKLLRTAPLLTASAVVVLGVVLAWRGLAATGIG